SAKPIPNSSENSTQNLPATNTCTSHATAWSAPTSPWAMPLPNSCHGRLNHSMLTTKMPASASPRRPSSSPIRSCTPVGASTAPLESSITPSPACACRDVRRAGCEMASVLVAALAMHVAVLDLGGVGLAHIDDL